MGYVPSITELKSSASASILCSHALYLPMVPRAIVLQLRVVEKLHDNTLWIRTAESTKDADTILKAFRNISSLCEVFQVSLPNNWPPRMFIEQFLKIDTQLNIEATVEDILQVLSLHRGI